MTCPRSTAGEGGGQPHPPGLLTLLDGAGARRCVCKDGAAWAFLCWLLDFTRERQELADRRF